MQVQTTLFSSDSDSIAVDILSDCSNPTSKQHQPVTVSMQPNAIVPLCLSIQPLPTAAKYAGRLIFTTPGAAPLVKVITLARPTTQQGILVLDHTTISQTISRAWWRPASKANDQMQCSVTVREKTGNTALHGVSVRLEQIASSPESGFDLKKNVKFQLNGHDDDLDSYPPASGDTFARTIPAGGRPD